MQGETLTAEHLQAMERTDKNFDFDARDEVRLVRQNSCPSKFSLQYQPTGSTYYTVV